MARYSGSAIRHSGTNYPLRLNRLHRAIVKYFCLSTIAFADLKRKLVHVSDEISIFHLDILRLRNDLHCLTAVPKWYKKQYGNYCFIHIAY